MSLDDVYANIRALIEDGLDPSDFVSITAQLTKLVQAIPELKGQGSAKKALVTEVFSMLVHKSGLLTKEQADVAVVFLHDTLPVLVDTLKELGREIASEIKAFGAIASVCSLRRCTCLG